MNITIAYTTKTTEITENVTFTACVHVLIPWTAKKACDVHNLINTIITHIIKNYNTTLTEVGFVN